MDLAGAGAELPQRLVRLLRVGVAALRERTLPFFGVLLQHRRVGCWRASRRPAPAQNSTQIPAMQIRTGLTCDAMVMS